MRQRCGGVATQKRATVTMARILAGARRMRHLLKFHKD